MAHIEKPTKVLGWKPKTSLEDGVKKTIDWYCENKKMLDKLVWKA